MAKDNANDVGTGRSIGGISTDLLEILICPACRAKVELKPDASGLRCVSCHRLYPIRDEIPVMLIDEATIDE
jgi:LSD1 subclass zinc finger protein